MTNLLHLKAGLFVLFFQLIGFSVSAQQLYYNEQPEFLKANSNWAFGSYAGLNFNNGTPAPIVTSMFSREGSATVSDRQTGELLFYSDGGRVWDANHQVMPNGAGLLGNPYYENDTAYATSTIQGVCIVPVIDDPDKYYLFSLSGFTSGGPKPEGTLFYSVVDMNGNGGTGDIVVGQKNVLLSRDTLAESMIAIPGDCNDVWLMVHMQEDHRYLAYHITTEGIDTTPIVSNSGYLTPGVATSGMYVSPDRQKIVLTTYGFPGFFLSEFDPLTGSVANSIFIEYPIPWYASFSPDNSKIYVAGANGGLVQYDLSVYDSASIVGSAVQISNSVRPNRYSALRLYDGKIYQLSHIKNFSDATAPDATVAYINNPNVSGLGCDYQTGTVKAAPPSLFAPHVCGLGSEVVFPMTDSLFNLVLDTALCSNTFTLNVPSESTNHLWDNGSNTSSREINAPGTYWVRYEDICANVVIDTFIISGMDLIPPVIAIDQFELRTTVAYDSYQWMFNGASISGATNPTLLITENGDYQVIVTNENGCTDTSDIYTVSNADIRDASSLNYQISVYPNPADEVVFIKAPIAISIGLFSIDGRLIKSSESGNELYIGDVSNGVYLVKISDKEGRLLKMVKLVK